MATQAETEAFQRAGVPAELEAAVHDRLRETGGDSENPDEVEQALDDLTGSAPVKTAVDPYAFVEGSQAASPQRKKK